MQDLMLEFNGILGFILGRNSKNHCRTSTSLQFSVGLSDMITHVNLGRLKTQVRICNGGKRKYSNLKSILKSLRFSTLAFSVDPLSLGLDHAVHLYCTRLVLYTRNQTHAGLMRRKAWVHKSQARRFRVTVLGKLFTPIVPLFIKQRNW